MLRPSTATIANGRGTHAVVVLDIDAILIHIYIYIYNMFFTVFDCHMPFAEIKMFGCEPLLVE